jgi:hypothetical protein
MFRVIYAYAISRIFKKWRDEGVIKKSGKFLSYNLKYNISKKKPYMIWHDRTPGIILRFTWCPTFEDLMEHL